MTAKERVLLLREGYEKRCNDDRYFDCATSAKHAYPTPKVTRPRVYRSTQGTQYRIKDGKVQHLSRYHVDGSFEQWSDSAWSVEDFKQFGALVANPTETVDDE